MRPQKKTYYPRNTRVTTASADAFRSEEDWDEKYDDDLYDEGGYDEGEPYEEDQFYDNTPYYEGDLPYEYWDDPDFYNDYLDDSAYYASNSKVGYAVILAPIVMVVVLILLALGLSSPATSASTSTTTMETPPTAVSPPIPQSQPSTTGNFSVIAPYDEYTLTQGPHGFSYGHMAIDLSAGEGAAIKAPISGTITERYVDEYNNPTLVIENDRYRITFLHGDYIANVGERVAQGQQIGMESNKGYTMDMYGNLCYGRAGCGHHTHLNIFDKQIGQNVNPITLISQ